MGRITAINSRMYRNSPEGGWKRQIPNDCNPQHVDWAALKGEAAFHPFDPNRVMNWRFYWDYSGGNVFENMVHQVGFWFKAMDLQIPERVTMSGANYLSQEMEVSDTMTVSMALPEKILFTWNSGFGSSYYDASEFVLGAEGTVVRNDATEAVTYVPSKSRLGAKAARTSSEGMHSTFPVNVRLPNNTNDSTQSSIADLCFDDFCGQSYPLTSSEGSYPTTRDGHFVAA